MTSALASAVALLTAALSLLNLVHQHPELPQSFHDNAVQVAQQAISQATSALGEKTKLSASSTVLANSSSTNAVQSTAVVPSSRAAPTVNIVVSPKSIVFDGTSTISWVAKDALSCTLNSSSVLLAPTGSQVTEILETSTTYTVNCTGAGGSTSDSANVNVEPWVPPPGVNVLPGGKCTRLTAPCMTGPHGMFCSKDGCGA